MSITKKINRYHVGELPLMEAIVKRLGLREILNEFIPQQRNEEMPPADVLILLIYNLTIGKAPLYELEEWVNSLDLRCIGHSKYKEVRPTDDRFGGILDKVYALDRASLMTRIVIKAVSAFNIDLKQLHNDSTTVKAFGEYPGKTGSGFELLQGNSKDYRPDLKQLVFSLSISSDGAIPVHYKSYPGNRNDDTTHIETWNTLCEINQSPDFLYVADCKLCSDSQLNYIVERGGRALTSIPEYWNEVKAFKESLRKEDKPRKEIWRRNKEKSNRMNYFFVVDEEQLTTKRGYKIHWIVSSEKKNDDYSLRQKHLKKAEVKLRELLPGINKRKLISEEAILEKCNAILKHHKVDKFIKINIQHRTERRIVKTGRGRPSKELEQKFVDKKIFTLSWEKDKKALEAERNVDGIYPLLSTDPSLSSREAIIAYKYQPKLEKRFTHLKSIHNIAPLLFKKLERIEANMFLFFIALMIQALIEREVRLKMKEEQLVVLQVYPENRYATHPTTSKVFDIFSRVSTYTITENEQVREQFADELNDVQKSILGLLSMEEKMYWHGITTNDNSQNEQYEKKSKTG